MKLDRFWGKVDTSGDCWLWTGYKDHNGYGCVNIIKDDGRKTTQKAHRFAYEAIVGPIPEGMDLDHECHVRHCVRPHHLQPVTHKQNLENRAGVTARNKSGHRGVCWDKRKGKWMAYLRHNNRHHHLGYFDCIDAAAEAARIGRLNMFTRNEQDKLADRKQRGVLQGSGDNR